MLMRTRSAKAKKEGRKAVKRARTTGKKAGKRAEKVGKEAQERAADYAGTAGDVASDLAERLRKSDSLAKAQAVGSEYATKARKRWEDSELEERLVDAAHRLRDTDTAKKAEATTKDVTEASLEALGEWLTSSKTGKRLGNKMGVQRKSRLRFLAATAIGVAAGFAIARLVQPKPLPELTDEFTMSANRIDAPAAGTALVDSIRAALDGDPRTTRLEELTINVAEGTVFVRGAVPEDADRDAISEVIGRVPGVTDVDLQLTTAASQQ